MFCKNCGEVLTDTEVACGSCGFAIGTGDRFCEQCGAETPSYAVVCELCGKEIVREPEDDTPIAMQYAQEPSSGYGQAYQYQQQPQNFQTYSSSYPANLNQAASTEGNWMQGNAKAKTPYNTVYYTASNTPKSKSVFIILGLFLGSLGLHDFYVGKRGAGLVHLFMTIFGFGFGGMLSWAWALIELFIRLGNSNPTDENGNPLE